MILSILDTLKNDKALNELLKPTPTDVKIHMFGTTEGIAYKVVPLTADAIKGQYRLEITVVDKTYAKANAIMARVKQLLLTIGDTPFNDKILSVVQNGGGVLQNEDTKDINLIAFFILQSRE